jgi:cytochrome c-type biogenesis protein CcmH
MRSRLLPWNRNPHATRIPVVRMVLAIAVAVAVLVPSVAAAATPPRSSVSDKIMCLCGCASVLTNCPHEDCGWGIPAKNYIDQRLSEGESPEALVQYYVDEYGEEVLAAPTKSGFNVTAWVMPFIALIVGGVAIYFLASAWTARRPVAATPAEVADTTATETDGELAHRLEDELRDFD